MGRHFRTVGKKLSPLFFVFLFPLIIFYNECVFRASTVGGLFRWDLLVMLLFSAAFGGVCYLLATLFRRSDTVHVISSVWLGLTAVLYLVEYFVYRQFKVFYDVNTVVGGAGDAMGGFTADIFALIFCWDGFLKISLFFLPVILFAVFGRRVFSAMNANMPRRIIAGAMTVLCFVTAFVSVRCNPVWYGIYKTQYNYQSAVENFGLLTGIRLDIENLIFPREDQSFEQPDEPVSEPEPPKQYAYHQMDLNLTGGTGRIKDINAYISTLTPAKENDYTGLFKGKNLIMISAEAFTAEVIDPTLTPTLYRLANKGIQFTDYYQPASAGTTGGEYQNVFGMLPTAGGASFKQTAEHLNYMTMGSQLNRLGYYGKAFHNNTHSYYSRHLTHTNLGYSDGYMGYGNGMEQYVKKTWPQSDLEMIAGTLPTYIDQQPFNVYYMTVSGHSGYSRTGNMMTGRNWDAVKDLPYSDQIKGYLAANLELEKAMAHLVSELELKGIADDTVICISTDHFPYGLDSGGSLGKMPYLSELYGYNVTNYFQRDHSRLILWCGALEKEEPIVVSAPTSSLDILPTLSNLFGTEYDSRLFPGRDVFSDQPALMFNTNYDWKTSFGTYYASTGKFVPVENAVVPEGYVEETKKTVRNKILYCKWALETDYFRYLFEK